MTAPTLVDAHQHRWDPATGLYGWLDRAPAVLRRRYTAAEVAADLDALGVDGTVLVQAADADADTDAMLAEADADPRVRGVVGYVPLHEPERAARRLAALIARPGPGRLVGVRNLIHDRPDPDWLLRPDVGDGLAALAASGLPFDLVGELPRHLEHVEHLATRFPQLTLVLDHLNKPPVGTDRREPWAGLLRRAAEHPQVVAKVSGLYRADGDPADPPAADADVALWVELALDAFGPERVMLGSDWPVAEVAGGYRAVTGQLLRIVDGLLDGDDLAQVRAGTAVRVYGLG